MAFPTSSGMRSLPGNHNGSSMGRSLSGEELICKHGCVCCEVPYHGIAVWPRQGVQNELSLEILTASLRAVINSSIQTGDRDSGVMLSRSQSLAKGETGIWTWICLHPALAPSSVPQRQRQDLNTAERVCKQGTASIWTSVSLLVQCASCQLPSRCVSYSALLGCGPTPLPNLVLTFWLQTYQCHPVKSGTPAELLDTVVFPKAGIEV